MESHPCPFSIRKQAGRTPSVRNEGTQKGLSSTEEASRQDFVLPERRCAKGLVLDRGSKQAGLRPTGTKARKRACPRARKQAGGTPSDQNDGVQQGFSSTEEVSR